MKISEIAPIEWLTIVKESHFGIRFAVFFYIFKNYRLRWYNFVSDRRIKNRSNFRVLWDERLMRFGGRVCNAYVIVDRDRITPSVILTSVFNCRIMTGWCLIARTILTLSKVNFWFSVVSICSAPRMFTKGLVLMWRMTSVDLGFGVPIRSN